MKILQTSNTFGAVFEATDLKSLTESEFDKIHAFWLKHKVIVFPGQPRPRLSQKLRRTIDRMAVSLTSIVR